MTDFTLQSVALVINNRRTRASRVTVEEITANDIKVWNPQKDEYQYFDVNAPHYGLGDYWGAGEPRPQLVATSDAEGARLDKETRLRLHAANVQSAAREYARTQDPQDHSDLTVLVAAWPGML